MALRVAIVGPNNGAGLQIDKRVLSTILASADIEHQTFLPSDNYKAYDANISIFLELFDYKKVYDVRGKKILIPNPEWFTRSQLPLIHYFDAIFVKSRQAEKIFTQYHKNVIYTRFTSRDLGVAQNRDWGRLIHVAGKSQYKGTAEVIKAWKDNRDLPNLWLIRSPVTHSPIDLPNVNDFLFHLVGSQLLKLQNQSGIHLCPSNAEGFGHYIWEALSLGALVITLDAPPMSEFVPNHVGFRVPAIRQRNINLGEYYTCKPQALAQTIRTVINLPIDEKISYSNAARIWWESNHFDFQQRFLEVINEIA